MRYLTLTISHGKRVLPYVRGRRVHDGRLRDSPRFAVCATTTRTGQLSTCSRSLMRAGEGQDPRGEVSGHREIRRLRGWRSVQFREVPGFDSLGLQPLPQCHPACGVLVLSVRAALSLVPPPRAPSLRTVSAAGLSDLTRFLLTRCGAEWCCCLVPLPCCCLVPLPLLFLLLQIPPEFFGYTVEDPQSSAGNTFG